MSNKVNRAALLRLAGHASVAATTVALSWALVACGGGSAASAPASGAETPAAPAPVAVPSAGSSTEASCARFYVPGFSLSTVRAVESVAPLARPQKGVAFADPSFNTCLVRATDHTADGTVSFARNDYSRRQAFNAGSTRQLVSAHDGAWHVYDANSHARLKMLVGPAADAEPQWHPTNAELLYYLPTNGMGMKLFELNVNTDVTRTLGDFGARLRARWPSANAAWTRSEGSPSADGRYWCFMVDDVNWNSLGVFTWDRDTNTILGMYDTKGDRPDHVSMSPSGQYCVVSGDGALGTTAFSRDFSSSRQLLSKSEHSDIALDANGDDVYVAVDYNSLNGDVFMVNIRTGVRTPLLSTYVDGTATALHVSGKAFDKKGWVVVSTYAESGALKWLHRKILAVQLAANPKVYTLAHHRSSANGYWTTPVASVNRDFTRVAFNSNWGTGSELDVDDYVIEIPAGSLD